jgi:histidyl-tRNA synthetase
MSRPADGRRPLEASIPPVKGTRERLPTDFARLAALEAQALKSFELAGYDRIDTPILEPVELHERKSGAGIVSKLFEVAGDASNRVCLRPELTAGIVRAYTLAEPAPSLPWRVSHAGPAFRRESNGRTDRLREFHQVGIERLGDSGAFADAEVISLAYWTLIRAGVMDPTIRLGHVGLILEILGRSGLPATAQSALVEMLSEAAADGGDVGSIGRGLDHFSEWLRQGSGSEIEEISLPVDAADDGGIDRLFRTLVPVITGRRAGHEIIHRLCRKWDLGHSWLEGLERVRDQVRALTSLKGPAVEVLDRLSRDFEALAPESVASIRELVDTLGEHSIDLDEIELDLGFGRGIGFYSQMVFEIVIPTPDGPVEVCGGGRYDGLARVFGSDRDARGVGFAFGLERLDTVLEALGNRSEIRKIPTFLVVAERPKMVLYGSSIANLIRTSKFRAIFEPGWHGSDLIERANQLSANWSLIVGGESYETPLTLIDHATGTKRNLFSDELQDWLRGIEREMKS